MKVIKKTITVQEIGHNIVEERTQLILAYMEMNKHLGYDRYNIMIEIQHLLMLMKKYGIKTNLNGLTKEVNNNGKTK